MISVLIASLNGEKTLPRTLSTIRADQVVVVDNGSTDNTRAVVESFGAQYVFEPRRGKNNALNTGLQFIAGDLIVFTDDDTIPSPDWIDRFREAAETHPDCTVFGGAILPEWDSPPQWIDRIPLGPAYGITPDRPEGPVSAGQVWGGNMMIRRQVFETHRFDGSVGPDGSTRYAQGSETTLCRTLEREGHEFRFVPEARVKHIIPASHMTRRWLMGRAYRYGRGEFRLAQKTAGRWMYRALLEKAAAYALHRTVETGWDFHYLRGGVAESRRA